MERNIRKIEPLAPKIPVKKRVAAYARVSSGKDAMLHSLSAQVSYYSDFIQKQKGWEYAGVYSDEALTGTKNDRPEFQRLLTDCRNGKIDMIITKSISRLARNTVTMLETVRELKSINIDVFFEKENIHSISGDGELMLSILASFAQEESRSVSENCKWRIRKQFADGELVNLRFMYGYHINKGTIEINEPQANVVRIIFKYYIEGMGCNLIAKMVQDLGIPSLSGGVWSAQRIADIIKNEKYAGNSLLQKQYVTDHLTKKSVRNKGELPKYYVENTHPPIIDEDTFHKAQEIMQKKRERYAGKNQDGQYPFTGKIICGKCGKKYKRKITRGRAYWNCSTCLQFRTSVCHTKQIPEGILFELAPENFTEIRVTGANSLHILMPDGSTVEKQWQYNSRSESWTEEMKAQARQKTLERNQKLCQQ